MMITSTRFRLALLLNKVETGRKTRSKICREVNTEMGIALENSTVSVDITKGIKAGAFKEESDGRITSIKKLTIEEMYEIARRNNKRDKFQQMAQRITSVDEKAACFYLSWQKGLKANKPVEYYGPEYGIPAHVMERVAELLTFVKLLESTGSEFRPTDLGRAVYEQIEAEIFEED